MLLEAIHVDCWFAYAVGWAAYAVVMNVHYILIMFHFNILFQTKVTTNLVISKINHSYSTLKAYGAILFTKCLLFR